MARLPQGADLAREPTGSNAASGVNVPKVDFSVLSRAQQKAAEGMGSIGASLTAIGDQQIAANEKADDYETQKALADFRLSNEAALDDYKNTMQPGGGNYAAEWEKSYTERANKFVRSLPEHMRGKVQSRLIAIHASTQSRVQAAETAERDRQYKAGLETTLGGLVGRVDRDVNNLTESRAEGRRLIQSSALSPAQKEVVLKAYDKRIESTAVTARIANAKSAGEVAEILKDLTGKASAPTWAGDLDGAATAPTTGPLGKTYMDRIKKFEGYTARAKWDYKQHSIGYGTRAKFPGERIDKAEAERRFVAEITSARKIVDDNFPGAPEGVKAALTSLTFNAGAAWIRQGLGKAVAAGDYGKAKQIFLKYNKARDSKTNRMEVLEGLTRRRIRESKWFDENPAARQVMATLDDDYDGPYEGLDAADRLKLRRTAEVRQRALITALGKQVTELEKTAIDGTKLNEDLVADLEGRVEQSGDDVLKAKMAGLVRMSEHLQTLQQQPLAANEASLNRVRQQFSEKGATPEQARRLETLEKVVAKQRTMLKNDALTWSYRTGVATPSALKLDDPESMQQRLQDATTTRQTFGSSYQLFTAAERDHLASELKDGKASIVQIASALVSHWGGETAQQALRELSAKAPGAATIGSLVAVMGANNPTARDYDQGRKIMLGDGFKTVGIKKVEAREAVQGILGDAAQLTPSARDNLQGVANVIYEARARRHGWTEFDKDEYSKIIGELVGRREIEGVQFGGIGQSTAGYMWDTNPVIVPHDVRADKFDDMRDMIKLDNLKRKIFRGKDQPLTASEWESAVWISAGSGQYAIAASNEDGEPVYYNDEHGKPYILSFSEVRQFVKDRRPDWFYDSFVAPSAVAGPVTP